MLLLLLAALSWRPARAASRPPPPPTAPLIFSAGFTDGAVLQRGDHGTAVYGFTSSAAPIKVAVSGSANYTVDAAVSSWVDDSGCNATACPDPRTHPMPAHGSFIWRAQLEPQPQAGGEYSISVADGASTITIVNLTY